jgi:hypothetical protein
VGAAGTYETEEQHLNDRSGQTMSDTTPTGFGRIYALRRETLLDVEGYRAFLKQEHPDIHDYLLGLDDLQLRMVMDAVARNMIASEGSEGDSPARPGA